MVRKLSGWSENEEIHSSDYQPKIEVVRCPQQKKECVAQLPQINQYFNESHQLRLNKDYLQSIQVLRQAFECTWQMHEVSCLACAIVFRELIIATLEAIRNELHELTTGWFGAHDYRTCLEMATLTLQECRERK